jgi:hypothetical protein
VIPFFIVILSGAKALLLVYFAFNAAVSKTPIRPLGPTTNGSESAFQCWSVSGASPGNGRKGRQLRPSSVEMSVPFAPTVIQVFVAAS